MFRLGFVQKVFRMLFKLCLEYGASGVSLWINLNIGHLTDIYNNPCLVLVCNIESQGK